MQQINLLDAALIGTKKRLGANQLVLAWAGFAVVLVLITSWQSASLWWLQDEASQTQAEVERVRQENILQRANTPDPAALQAQVAELLAQQNQQAQLMALLRQQKSMSFSPYLAGLAKARVDNLWLSEIYISHGATRMINLKGSTLDASLVPVMLRNLAEQEQFRGQRFDQFEITTLPDSNVYRICHC